MLLVGANDQANKKHSVLLAEIECLEQHYSILIKQFIYRRSNSRVQGVVGGVLRSLIVQPVERTFSSQLGKISLQMMLFQI